MALRGVCPRCASAKLFKGAFSLSLKETCPSCGLDHTAADVGDGAVVPVVLLGNILMVGFALWLHFSWQAPVWLTGVLTIVVAFLSLGWLIKFLKAWLYAQKLRHDAAPGRLS